MSGEKLSKGYKQTDVGVIPEDWEVVTLDSVAKLSSGTTPSRSQEDRYYRNGIHHWVKTTDLNNSEIQSTEEKVTKNALDETCLQVYPSGTVLIAMYGGFNQIGRTGLLQIPAAVNQALVAVQAKPSKLAPEYLLANLNYCIDYWKSVASSSRKDPNITSQDIRNFAIPLPRLQEQKAIARTLSDTDALIESLEQLITKKRHIKQGAMQELLKSRAGWTTKRIGDVLTISHGRSQHAVEDRNGEYPILATGGQIGWANQYLYDQPSVLIGRKGTIDKPRYANQPFWTVDTLFYSRVLKPNNAKYLFYQFCLIPWKEYNEASGVPSLNARTIESIEIKVPKSQEQTAIARILSDMDTEITTLETKLTKTRQLKQGMMRELLTGRIRLI